MAKPLPPDVKRITDAVGVFLLLVALAASIAMLVEDRVMLVARPLTTISVGGVLVLFLLRESILRRHLHKQSDELRQGMHELEEKNRWLKMTEANAHVGHWRLDLKTDEVFWSDETFAIHGVEVGNAPELADAIKFYHPDDRSTVEQAVEAARDTGEPFSFRARIMRTDGNIRHTESIARLQYDHAGKPAMLFGVLADRTEEEAMRRDLRDARDEARAMAAAKSDFLAKVSHEIRTPMNGVLGFADLLLASELNPSQKRHAGLIAESGRNLQTLLNDILDLSKIEAGRMQIKSEPTELAALLRSTVQLAEPIAREKSLRLVCEVDPLLPRGVLIDALRLRQVINNLMANAMRFTDRGSVALSAQAQSDRMVISVSDSGIGIEREMQDAIFDAFGQADAEKVQRRGGTGLGLAICRQLAELMGGSLTVESEPGIGSRFILNLPLACAPLRPIEHEQLEPSQSRSRDFGQARVLLAEDYDINRELIAEMAKRLNLALDEAEDGAQAVTKVRDAARTGAPYALVLMDVQMPVMDGIAASKVIREAGFGRSQLPILALTANAFAEDVEACRAAGMQEHLAKPLTFDSFAAALERWLPSSRAAAA